jgi:hypothetical protein
MQNSFAKNRHFEKWNAHLFVFFHIDDAKVWNKKMDLYV